MNIADLKIKVYMSGPYTSRFRVREFAQALEKAGLIIVSSWQNQDYDDLEPGMEAYKNNLRKDLIEMREADLCLFYDPMHEHHSGFNRHFEIGWFVGNEIPVLYLDEEGSFGVRGFYNLEELFPRIPMTVDGVIGYLEAVHA